VSRLSFSPFFFFPSLPELKEKELCFLFLFPFEGGLSGRLFFFFFPFSENGGGKGNSAAVLLSSFLPLNWTDRQRFGFFSFSPPLSKLVAEKNSSWAGNSLPFPLPFRRFIRNSPLPPLLFSLLPAEISKMEGLFSLPPNVHTELLPPSFFSLPLFGVANMLRG